MHRVSTSIFQFMPDRYQNKYRISSARLPDWDYGKESMYYITVCTQQREHSFCCINGRVVCLSEIGQVVHSEWLQTPTIRPDMNLELGEFVVMPNHFHSILIIGANEHNKEKGCRDAMHRVSTQQKGKNAFGP